MSEPVAGVSPAGWGTPPAGGSSDGGHGAPGHPAPAIPDHELLHPIGRGAYGEVWLGRTVVGTPRAVKVVHRRDFGDARPFEREFKGIQRFEPVSRAHPGLVDILQVGRNDAEGYFYYVMELADPAGDARPEGRDPQPTPVAAATRSEGLDSYVPRTLRQGLKTLGRLPFEESVRIGLALAGALEHLHRQGLVHRDIKPSNIIFVKGQPKLADIGLVAALDEARSMVGTAGYIPPEGPGTARADVYSLGKVLYEMAFGKDRQEFPQLPVDLRHRPDQRLLLELNAVILKACEPDPSRRYHTAGEMATDLARLQCGGSVLERRASERALRFIRRAVPLAVLLALMGWVASQVAGWVRRRAVAAADKASVFVLPFRPDGADVVAYDVRDRITDAFIDALALVEGVRRSPRTSGWELLDEDAVRRALPHTNDLRHILTGRVGGGEGRLLLTLRLYERGMEKPIWTEGFSVGTNEVILLERRALDRLAKVLGLSITEAEQRRIDRLLTNNLEALSWCRQGWQAQRSFSIPRLIKAKEAFHRATELDPNYVEAHYGVLWVYRVSLEKPQRDVWPDIRSRARWILALDPTHPNTRGFLGWASIFHDHDWAHGIPELESTLREMGNPGSSAHFLRVLGRWEEARRLQAEWDARGERGGPLAWHSVAAKHLDKRHADVVAGAREIQKRDREHHVGYWLEGVGHLGLRDYPAAIDAIQRGRALYERQDLRGLLGYVYARMGERDQALAVLHEFDQLSYAEPYWVARIHAALGHPDQALAWLERACEERSELLVHVDTGLGGLRLDEAWDGLRSEPRFLELLRKTGLDIWPK